MARSTPDGVVKLHWVPAIASTSAPTMAELAAGEELTPFLAPAGINFPDEGAEADASDLSSARDKSVPATVGGVPEGEFYRDDTNDDAWDTLVRGTAGYLVYAPFGGTGTGYAIQATDTVEVWTVRVSSRNPNRVARGEVHKFVAKFSVEADPVYAAVMAA